MKDEIWKDIKNYEGLYQVSNLGNVRSLDKIDYIYNFKKEQKVKRIRKGKIIKHNISNKGYKFVSLYKNKKRNNFYIHRLVAQTFIQNIDNLPIINHIDGNKLNNNISNLEWCTYSHNVKEAYRLGLETNTEKQKEISRIIMSKTFSKIVIQYDLNGNEIKKWKSQTQAAKVLGLDNKRISKATLDKNHLYGGYIWRSE